MENLLRRRVLVTGATGFVGAAICRRMHLDGWQIRGAVRSVSDHERLPLGVEAVTVGSIGPDTEWAQSLADVDIVVHLAARTHVTHEMAIDPLKAYQLINVVGTERLARAAGAANVSRFIYLSSVKVNGEGKPEPYTEENLPAPEDPYGESKLEAEEALQAVSAETGVEVVIIRPPLVYGPGVKANFLHLLKTVHHGTPLPLGRIRNRRSFIYLGNLVDAIAVCISRPEASGRTFLVSDGEDISTPELIRRISISLGKPARLFPFPHHLLCLIAKLTGRSAMANRLIGSLEIDISRIRRELGWSPPYTMEQGLWETATWFKKECIGNGHEKIF